MRRAAILASLLGLLNGPNGDARCWARAQKMGKNEKNRMGGLSLGGEGILDPKRSDHFA